MPPVEFVDLSWRDRCVRIELQRIAPAHARADAPLMLLLHEGLGSLAMWRDFPQRLCDAAGVHGLVYSRPGYGRSTPRDPTDHWDVDFMHRQAHEVLPALLDVLQVGATRRPLWLFGHSDGGSIALLHAALTTRPVTALVVMAPHILVEDVSVASIEAAKVTYETTDLRDKLGRYHDDVDSAFRGWNDIWLDPDFRSWNIESALPAIRCPILAIQGEDDEYGTMQQIERIATGAINTRVELVKLANCRHSPHRDQPDAVIAAVRRFLAT